MATTRNELESRMELWWDRLRTFRMAVDLHNSGSKSRFGMRILEHHIRNCLRHLKNIGLALLELELQVRQTALALMELEQKEMTANG